MQISRKRLFEVWRSENNMSMKNARVLDAIMNNCNFTECSTDIVTSVKKVSDNFCAQLWKKWLECYRVEAKFLTKNSVWLEGFLTLPEDVVIAVTPRAATSGSVGSSGRGRPRKLFHESSVKTKQRRVASY